MAKTIGGVAGTSDSNSDSDETSSDDEQEEDDGHDDAIDKNPEYLSSPDLPIDVETDNQELSLEIQNDFDERTDASEPSLAEEDEEEEEESNGTHRINYKLVREALDKFFQKRVSFGVWPKTTLPVKGKDKEFDDLMESLGLVKKRSYVAGRWRRHKNTAGLNGPIMSSDVEHNNKLKHKNFIAAYEETEKTSVHQSITQKVKAIPFEGSLGDETEEMSERWHVAGVLPCSSTLLQDAEGKGFHTSSETISTDERRQ